jgi:Tol biopolymer transport system component
MRRALALCGAVAVLGIGTAGIVSARSLSARDSPVSARVPTSVFRPPPFTLPLPPPVAPPPGFTISAGPIVFVSTRDGPPEAYEMDRSGTGQTRLTADLGTVADPTLSGGGDLTFSAAVAGHREIVSQAHSGAVTQLTHDGRNAREPRWLDSHTLLYVSDRSGNDDVWELDTKTGAARDLTASSPAPDVDPAPSPDGKHVAFASDRGSGYDIYVLTLADGSLAQLTRDGAGNAHPSWSPDGSRIAYDRRGAGGSDIWTAAADGSDPRPLVATGADEFEPSYAPAPVGGAARLVFVTDAKGNYEIWIVGEDGSGAVNITQSPGGDDVEPFWAPSPEVLEILLQPVQLTGGGPATPRGCTIAAHAGSHTIVGTKQADVICGTNRADVIRGKAGNDVIYSGGGADTIRGGDGDDLVYAHDKQTDTIYGGAGQDLAYADRQDTVQNAEVLP